MALTQAAAGLGVGQTWQNVTGARALGTQYTNTSSKPIALQITVACSAAGKVGTYITINGSTASNNTTNQPSGPDNSYGSIANYIVPPGATYTVTGINAGALNAWWELS